MIDQTLKIVCSCCKKSLATDFFTKRSESKTGFKGVCKTCKNEKSVNCRKNNLQTCRAREKKYREQNKERELARIRQWKHINKSKLKERYRLKCIENPAWHQLEKIRAKTKYWENIEESREYRRKYAAENSEKAVNRVSAWAKKHPEQARANKIAAKHKRRARERLISKKGCATGLQILMRIEVFEYKCYLCAAPYEQIDHVIPISKGGANLPANLRPICGRCNRKKGSKKINEIQRNSH